MATPIDAEPRPRPVPRSPERNHWEGRPRIALARTITEPKIDFLGLLRRRRSSIGHASVAPTDLSSLLWHAMLLRARRPATADFAAWESRATPSAGGIHCISLLCLPIEDDAGAGLFDPERHELVQLPDDQRRAAVEGNRRNVAVMCGATCGTTLQFVADIPRIDGAYENAETLIWRDAGALTMTLALAAEALDLAALPLGRTGAEIVTAAGFGPGWRGVGAIHISSGTDGRA